LIWRTFSATDGLTAISSKVVGLPALQKV